jgi:hypothetical protein
MRATPPAPAPNNAVPTANLRLRRTPARSAGANSSADNANWPSIKTWKRLPFNEEKYSKTEGRSKVLTGTHFRSTVCLTQEEISATDGNTNSDLKQLDRAGRSICPNNNCGTDQ